MGLRPLKYYHEHYCSNFGRCEHQAGGACSVRRAFVRHQVHDSPVFYTACDERMFSKAYFIYLSMANPGGATMRPSQDEYSFEELVKNNVKP